MVVKISKCQFQKLFIGGAAQIKVVYKDHKILITLKGCITLSFKFLEMQHKFLLFYDCRTSKNIFRLYEDRASKTKAVNLKVNCKELRLIFVYHVNIYRVYLNTCDCLNKLILWTFI